MTSKRRWWRTGLNWLFGGCAAFLGCLLMIMVIIPLIMGWVPLTVLTGSMEPTIPTGSQVIVKRMDSAAKIQELKTGDVITFMPLPDNPTLVTHRIVQMSAMSDGSRSFITKGDHNNAVDSAVVTEKMLRAKVVYHVPYAGYIAQLLNREQKSKGVIVVSGLLLCYAMWQLISALRSHRRQRISVRRPT